MPLHVVTVETTGSRNRRGKISHAAREVALGLAADLEAGELMGCSCW